MNIFVRIGPRHPLSFGGLLAAFVAIPWTGIVAGHEQSASEPLEVELSGVIHTTACKNVVIDGRIATLNEQRSFSMKFPIEKPRYAMLNCGEFFALYLTPGESLHLEIEQDGSIRFEGRGAEVNNLLAELSQLRKRHAPTLLRRYPQLAELPEEPFITAWDEAYAVLFDPVRDRLKAMAVPSLVADVENARVLYAWAEGRVRYPFRRWITSGIDITDISAHYDSYLSRLNLNHAELLPVREYSSFLDAYVHERARCEMRKDETLRTGDNQWTRAKYSVALSTFTDKEIQNSMLHSILMHHIEHYGSKGLENLVERFKKDCSRDDFVEDVVVAHQKDQTYWADHRVETYKTIGGVTLEAHVFGIVEARNHERRPAIVWFHGGSWHEGAWYWTLGLGSAFVSKRNVFISIEYRIHDRHGTTPLECISDARSAIRWVRANAERLGVDPNRIVACGFSSGGHLAAATAMLDAFDEPGEDRRISARPNAVVLVGACVDPTRDPWFRRMVERQGAPENASPAHHVRAELPPMSAIHGTADFMCPYSTLESFAERMKDAGNQFQMDSFAGRSHFFLWENHEDRKEAVQRISDFLASIGFAPKSDSLPPEPSTPLKK